VAPLGWFPPSPFISTVSVRNSSLPTFWKVCGVRGMPQTAVPRYRPSFRRPGVGKHIPVGITPDEIAGPEDIKNTSPAVGVHRYRGARWNTPIENSDSIFFEEDRVEPWRRDHGVELVGPGPSGGGAAASQGDDSLRAGIAV
jgi:hypothetical protein